MKQKRLNYLLDMHETSQVRLVLNNKNLCGLSFKGRNLTDAQFNDCNLHRSYFKGANLTGVVFRRSNLNLVDMSEATLDDTDFAWSSLSQANFNHSRGTNTNLSQTTAHQLRMARAEWYRTNLAGVLWHHAVINGAKIINPTVSSTVMPSACILGSTIASGEGPGWSNLILDSAEIDTTVFEDIVLYTSSFRGANMSHTTFRNCQMNSPTFNYATINECDWETSIFNQPDLTDAKVIKCTMPTNLRDQVTILPEGDLIGWKKAQDFAIVKLLIPASADRSSATGRKCRTSKAKVLSIYHPTHTSSAKSLWDSNVVYRVGEWVEPTRPFDHNSWVECGIGIHFYLTRSEAEAHI